MKKAKISLFALAAVLAVGSAFATAKRVTRIFFQPTPGAGNTWKLLTQAYDPDNCKITNNTYCVYTISNSAVLPATPTTAQLVAAGALPHNQDTKYIPQ